VLLNAFRRVCERGGAGRAAELHLLGRVDTQELEKELREIAAGLPVVFHGRYSYEALARLGLHVAVFPTVCFETFGFVLDECFELGLPCIVSAIGALPERAGRAALVVAPNDAGSLAAALARVLERPALLDELRAAIPPLAPTPAEHGAALARVYAKALATPRAAAVATIPATRRAQFLLRQRESLERRVEPPGGPR